MDMNEMLKQAQKLQKDMENAQHMLETEEMEISSAGGAVKCKVTGSTKFTSFSIDDAIISEGKEAIETAILAAVQEAVEKSKQKHEDAMRTITSGLELPGMDELEDLGLGGDAPGSGLGGAPRPRAGDAGASGGIEV